MNRLKEKSINEIAQAMMKSLATKTLWKYLKLKK